MKTTKELPAWDLSDLYKGITDPKINIDMEKYRKFCISFARKYKGKLQNLSAQELGKILKNFEKHESLAGKLCGFANLYMVTRMKDQQAVAFYQNIMEKMTDYSKPLVFFNLEINSLPQEKIKAWLSDKNISHYRPWFERVRRFKKYELSEPVEEVLLEKSLTSSSAWVRLYEETSARLTYTLNGKKYNSAEISKFLLDKDAKTRKAAGIEMNKVAKENSELFTFIYNMIIKDKAIGDEKRGFSTPVSARNLSENVSDKTVEALSQSVRKSYASIAHRYYKLKAKWLKMKKISYWDRNAPLPFSQDITYSWEDAVSMVLEAYKQFSPKLHNIAKDFFTHDWIDVPPRDGKGGGAFCAPVTVDSHPYLFLNFTGKQNDVLTLAHELGHGCHHQVRTQNGELNEYSRMTTEEVASVFGEMITFQSMVRNLPDDKNKLALIASKVGDMINTAIRQIAFHFFELRAHQERRSGELSTARLNQIWQEEMRTSLGDYVEVGDDCAYIWSQVGHFFFLPFYVYAYSFADCLVNSLYEVSQEKSIDNFAEKYMQMLSKTAITDYKKLLKPFNLDPTTPDFWYKGLNLISRYIDELERLDKKLKL